MREKRVVSSSSVIGSFFSGFGLVFFLVVAVVSSVMGSASSSAISISESNSITIQSGFCWKTQSWDQRLERSARNTCKSVVCRPA